MIRVLFTIILVFFCVENFAQNDCSDNLRRARQNFEDGIIEDIPSLLVPCLNEGFSREEKISAYKILILTYLFDDNQADAEIAILNFFKEFPNYEVRTDDPAEFIYLFESYKAVPIYSFYGGLGANQSVIHIRKVYSASPTPGSTGIKLGKTGFSFMAGASYSLSKYVKNLNANIRFELSQSNFEFEESIENTALINFAEKQTRINIPLFASYDLSDLVPELSVSPEFYLGANFEFITSAKGTPTKSDYSGTSYTGSEESILSHRRSFEPSLLVGVNYSYPISKGTVFLDVHSKIGFAYQSKNRLTYNDFLWSDNYYIDDNFLLHNVFINIGYRYTFYKPAKIR